MKLISYISGILFLAFSISCSDDFLSNNKREVTILTDTLFLNNNPDIITTSIAVGVIPNSNYTILTQPRWLSFRSMHGKITDGSALFSVVVVEEYVPPVYQTQYSYVLIEAENAELFMFIVALANLGSPVLQCSVSSLNFESPLQQTFTITNTASGILNWEIRGVPDWLIISETSGSLDSNIPVTVSASLNLDNMPPGQDLNTVLQIKSNSITGNITLPVHASAVAAAALRKIEGIVTDSEYNHDSGIMVICTKSPNTLIIFNTNTSESNTISLSRTPNCISLSEDGHKAVIGYSVAEVSYIDIDNLEVTGNYIIDCIPYDIVIGDDGWCYITPIATHSEYLRNLNTNSGELIVSTNPSIIHGRTILRKIYGKPYLVGTKPDFSPSGFIIFDVTKGKASDTISLYHENIGNFTISTDLTKLYASTKTVYSLPEYNSENNFPVLNVYGLIESDLYNSSGLEECPAINSIFIFSYYFGYSDEFAARIEQYNTISLNKTKTYHVTPVHVTEEGITLQYETSPKYIFVNKEGSILYAIKNLNENAHKDYWSIESINIAGK